jgi:phosphatidylethanolamine/phosphatidyl-N-methylethanolamine N-methyltransferase
MVGNSGRSRSKSLSRLEERWQDEARFIKSWFDKPLVTGAISPSSPALAKMMARYVDPLSVGPIIELGPGTGPVTQALLERGVAEERLVLVEYDPVFCEMLARKFPKARIVQGDAYGFFETAGAIPGAAAIVSSLPLFTKTEERRIALVEKALELAQDDAPFIQFTYAVMSPLPLDEARVEAHVSPRVWLNVPPARVWVYRPMRGPMFRRKKNDLADTVKIGTRFVRREFNASRARLEMKIAQGAGRLRHNPRLKPALDFFEKIGEVMESPRINKRHRKSKPRRDH